MSKGNVASKNPAVLDLEPGSYYWCACGQSKNQPWCDGSHQGTAFQPVPLEITEKKTVALCACKQTNNPPYCDGSHTKL